MGFLKKLKDTAEKGVVKSTELGKQGIVKSTELGKQGIVKSTELGKQGAEKIEDAKTMDNSKEIKKIEDKLDSDETVIVTARQSRVRPGGTQITTPNIIFATTKRIIIRNPNLLGLREDVDDYSYENITSVKLEKGLFSSSIHLVIPGMTEMSKSDRHFKMWGRNDAGVIDAIPKDKAEELYSVIKDKIREAKEHQKTPSVMMVESEKQNPMDTLKLRFVNGEITKEEYEDMKQVLEG